MSTSDWGTGTARLHSAAAGAAIVLLWPADAAAACPVCFSNASGPLIDGARLGVFAMVGVTVCVLVGFAAFFRRLARLAKQAELSDSSDAAPEAAPFLTANEGQS